MQQWARQEQAPHGAAMVLETEIAARARGGVDWRHDSAISVAVLARPRSLDVGAAEAGWLAAGLAAARALDKVLGGHHDVVWPDAVASTGTEVATTAYAALGAGRVEFVTLVVRLARWPVSAERADLQGALVDELRAGSTLLEQPSHLAEAYAERCPQLGHPAEIALLPHGTTRAIPIAVAETGALVVASPTGLEEHVSVAGVRHVRSLEG